MKKILGFLLVLALIFSPAIYGTEATELDSKGVSQGALVNALNAIESQLNVLVANVNLVKSAGIIQLYGALLSDPFLAVGGTNTKIQTKNAISYTVGGVYYSKAATDDVCDLTAIPALTTGYKKVILSVGSAGTCTVTASAQAASLGAVVLPTAPVNEIVIGGLTIGDGGAHDFAAAAVTADGGVIVPASYFARPLVTSVAVGTGTKADPKITV